LGQRERLINKSFLVLFLKKELLPCLSQLQLWSRSGMGQSQGSLVLKLLRLDRPDIFLHENAGPVHAEIRHCVIDVMCRAARRP
jgi:hypothetical protein